MNETMKILESINDALWTYVVIAMLVGCALYFTIRLRGLQFRYIGEMLRCFIPSRHSKNEATTEENAINSFQAFAVSLSSRVGTGNLAGVASAIFVGGPGAVFWMWVMALLGSATAFVEATLAQLYKRRGHKSFYGGPAYYMKYGLHRQWMGVLFAILIMMTFGLANQMVQSTTICDGIGEFVSIEKHHIGIALTIMMALIVYGGVQRVSRFSAVVVPIMAIGYILLAIYIVLANITMIPDIISLIVKSALGMEQAAGGMVGVAVMQGVKRGLFSNEAGEGSAPNAAAIASTSHPVKQGLLQAFGVFTDTIIICTCTASIILIAGNYDSGRDGILLTADALEQTVGHFGHYYLIAAIFLFAFSTIIANCFYGEANIRFITKKKWAVQLFRATSCAMVFLGSVMSLQTAWVFVDLCMGLMTICNIAAIVQLFPKAKMLFEDYTNQRREGKDPRYHHPVTEDIESWGHKPKSKWKKNDK